MKSFKIIVCFEKEYIRDLKRLSYKNTKNIIIEREKVIATIICDINMQILHTNTKGVDYLYTIRRPMRELNFRIMDSNIAIIEFEAFILRDAPIFHDCIADFNQKLLNKLCSMKSPFDNETTPIFRYLILDNEVHEFSKKEEI